MTSTNGSKVSTQQVGTTVLVVMMEVDPADDAVFNKWYNEEHLPERMSIPGYISARRFMLDPEDGQANNVMRYLCIWEMEDDSPLQSQFYQDQNAKPTPTKDAAGAVVKKPGARPVPTDFPGRRRVQRPGWLHVPGRDAHRGLMPPSRGNGQ